MRKEDLAEVKLPDTEAEIINKSTGQKAAGKVKFRVVREEEEGGDSWYLEGEITMPDLNSSSRRLLLAAEDISDILDDSLNVDVYFQDVEFRKILRHLAENLCNEAVPKVFSPGVQVEFELKPGTYVLQRYAVSRGENLLAVLGEIIRKDTERKPVPAHLRVDAPAGFVPDKDVLEAVRQHLYDGTPAIALLGPTGSGKSALARYIGHHLSSFGYGVHIIDAHARLEGDRLFERDDFNEKGTFIQEGVLLRLARETQKMGLKLIVVLEEYNAFTDETRREFYRLFNDMDRRYPIQSTKGGKAEFVDFSHVQFILTGNPLTSHRYLTDDLKSLSNAESRRLVILYQGYTQDEAILQKILRSIIYRKESYQQILRVIPDIDGKIDWNLGVSVFKALNTPGEGKGLGFDTSYQSVAQFLWTVVLRGHRQDAYAISAMENLLNPIPDIGVRSVAAQRLQTAAGIHIPADLLARDA